MMSYTYIRQLATDAANKARRTGRKPITLGGLGDDAVRTEMRHIPFLGDYVPRGFKRVDAPDAPGYMACNDGYLMVDSSGFGGENEAALTVEKFADYAARHHGLHYGIAEAGQFQVVIATYEKAATRRAV